MRLLAEISHHGITETDRRGKALTRSAVRGIVYLDDKLLMVHSTRHGDYKFPGGGRKLTETVQQALARELGEECGAKLVSITDQFGRVLEYSPAKEQEFDIFQMKSDYYFCTVESQLGEQRLDDYELEYGFHPVWISVNQALAANQQLKGTNRWQPPWLDREILVLTMLRDQSRAPG